MKNSNAGTIAKLLSPARWVMDRLTYPRKFALVSLLFMLPLASVMYSLLSEFEERVQFSEKELQGIRYIRVLSLAQVEMGQAMHLAERHAMGDQTARAQLVGKQGNVLDTLARLELVEKELGLVLDTGTLFAVLKENHRFLQASLFGKETKDSISMHAQVLQDIAKLNAHVGDTSNLILDPELTTYYLMDISLNRVPYTTDLLIQVRSLLSRVEGAKRMTELDQAETARLAGLLEDEATKIQNGLKVVYLKGSDARLQSALSDAANYHDRSQKALIQALRGDLASSADVARTASVLYSRVNDSSVAATSLSERTTNALQDLLNVRVNALVVRERWIVASALVALALVLYLLSAFYASVMNIVTRLQAAALRMRSGDFQDTLTLQSDDELGQVAIAFNKVAVQLREEKQQADIESERARKAEAELREQEAQLLASREEALAAARAKASFLATMSHEIRTPLNGVVGMTSLLADTSLTLEQQDYVHTMRVSSDQLLAVINDILDFSKIESGKLDLEHELVNLHSTVEEACDIAAPKAREKGLEILVDMDDGVPQWVLGDVTRLRQVLLNLINNAVKFTDKGQVIVSAVMLSDEVSNNPNEPQFVEFRVKDTGIGIPLDQQGALFQSFSQADTSTTRKYGGSGLGLAICKRLAELMGGTVGLQSTVGEGSSFWFTAHLQATKPHEDLGKQHLQMTSLVGRRILVVDDTQLNLTILDKQLKRWGMQVTMFERAPLALAWLSNNEVDVVLTDMHMPMMDGIEFAEELRKAHFHAPVLLLTSGTLPVGEDAVNFSARLFKPYRQSQLFNTLSSLLVKQSETTVATVGVAKPVPTMNERILLVDDNSVNLKVALAMLKKLGYQTDTGINGLEAIELVEKSMKPGARAYACVLMDANMPVIDGYEATRRIISRWGAKAPPIFALTASVMEEDRQRSSEAGMIAFLSKPLRMDELGEAIRQYARLNQTAAHNTASVTGEVNQATAIEPVAGVLMDWSRLDQFKEYDDDEMTMTREVIDLFTADAPARMAAIRQALASSSASEMAVAAHALRGAASNVGAAALATACQALEDPCKNGQWPDQADAMVIRAQKMTDLTLMELYKFTT